MPAAVHDHGTDIRADGLQRASHNFADAEARGDRYTLIQLRTVQHPNVLMTEDRPDAARDELARVGDELAQQPMQVQHWQHMQATAMVALYSGDPVTAVRHIEARLPAARRAFVLHVKLIRAMTYVVRGNAYAAAAALGGPEAARWHRCAAADFRRVRRIGGIPAAADLLAAQLALLDGDRPRAQRLFHAAGDGFAAVDMGLCSAAARWRCAQLARDDAGAAAIEADLAAEGVVYPPRMLAMMAPVAP